jgi:ribulose 1,5-bisphosphate synthetase/thiazole synthase
MATARVRDDAFDVVIVGGGHNGLTAGCYLVVCPAIKWL